MRSFVLALVVIAVMSSSARAQTPSLEAGLADVAFLVGSWGSGTGTVAEIGGTSRGSSTIVPEAGGAVLLRRDHTDLLAPDGTPRGGFDQIMLIYPEAGTLHADYADGDHIIHYVSATVDPGKSVVFVSAPVPTAPTFRLTYELAAPGALTVRFEMASPGAANVTPIATGRLVKQP